jgi:hypothetical protein
MNKEYLWKNKEFIIKKLYIVLGCLVVLYLIVNLTRINSNSKQTFDSNEFYSLESKVSSEYIPAIITYSE